MNRRAFLSILAAAPIAAAIAPDLDRAQISEAVGEWEKMRIRPAIEKEWHFDDQCLYAKMIARLNGNLYGIGYRIPKKDLVEKPWIEAKMDREMIRSWHDFVSSFSA